jgi:regulator of protease activity HflC (stomatin/prohibitin superfamily)
MTRAKPRRNDDRTVTQTGARPLVEEGVAVDGDPDRRLPVCARAPLRSRFRLADARSAGERPRGRPSGSVRAQAPKRFALTAALIIIAILLALLVLVLISAIKVAREYERAIVFRLGRLFPEPKGPGLFILIPIVDRMVRVDLRTVTLNIPPQEVITKDNVPARVNAVAYFRIVEPKAAIVQIENFMVATSQIAQTTLRAVLGQHLLDELLSERDKINAILQEIIDEATTPWGIKVARVEVKDLEIPSGMQQAMARQAEAERERRAKIINAEGEFQASERLKDAALVIEQHPTALQLRYLQTLLELGGSQTTTVVFPVPIDLIRPFLARTR